LEIFLSFKLVCHVLTVGGELNHSQFIGDCARRNQANVPPDICDSACFVELQIVDSDCKVRDDAPLYRLLGAVDDFLYFFFEITDCSLVMSYEFYVFSVFVKLLLSLRHEQVTVLLFIVIFLFFDSL